jgi:hypothetical protein
LVAFIMKSLRRYTQFYRIARIIAMSCGKKNGFSG